MSDISLKLCCVSSDCKKILTHDDNINDHLGHNIVLSKTVIEQFEKHLTQLSGEFQAGIVDSLRSQREQNKHQQFSFIKKLIKELDEFQLNMQARIMEMKDQLIKVIDQMQGDDENVSVMETLSKKMQNSHDHLDEELLKILLKLSQEKGAFLTEKELKDGIKHQKHSPSQTTLQIQLDNNGFDFWLPSQYQTQLKLDSLEQESKQCFISNKVSGMTSEFFDRLDIWDRQIGGLLVQDKNPQQNLTANFVIQGRIEFTGQQATKILFLDTEVNPITIIVYDRQVVLYESLTNRIQKVLSFSSVILDADVDLKRSLLAICMMNRIKTFNLKGEVTLQRSYKCQIDLSKSVRIKFLENQICVSCGTQLEFLPLNSQGKTQSFIQQINFNSYWDRISVVDYIVQSTPDLILIVGTIAGTLALYNCGFKELYSKQHHQGSILQIRFLQSEQYGKVIVSAGEDLKININVIEHSQSLRCVKVVKLCWPIHDILIYGMKLFVTVKGQSMLQMVEVNEKFDTAILPTQIVDDSENPLIEFFQGDILNLHKNQIVIAQDSRVLFGRLLVK